MNFTNGKSVLSIDQFSPDVLKKIEDSIVEFEREKERHRAELNERLTEWMRMNGVDPKTHILIAPFKYRKDLPDWCWPEFIRFSPFVESFMLLSRTKISLPGHGK